MKQKNLHDLVPAYLIHPGEILKDELIERNLSQAEFAKTIGIERSQLNEYIKGKRDFSAELCLLVAAALKMNETIWLNLKQNYEVDRIKISKKAAAKLALVEEFSYVNTLPKKFLKQQGYLTEDKEQSIEKLRGFYQVSNLKILDQKLREPRYAYHRKSEKRDIEIANLFTWEQLIKHQAAEIEVGVFNASNAHELVAELKPIFKENSQTLEKCKTLLGLYGIKLIHQVKPEKCAVDGFSFWSNGKPAIGLSLRYNRIDNLAFTLMHELGHVYLHLPHNLEAAYIDAPDENGSYGDSIEEKEANDFAKDQLISKELWEDFKMRYFKPIDEDFEHIAEQSNIHPAIPFGRFCFETMQYKKRTKIERVLR